MNPTDTPNCRVTAEMQTRIDAGKLDWKKGPLWHDPGTHNPEQERRNAKARSFARPPA